MDALPEVLLLVVCATIASCDDYDEIVAWGEAHLGFLRRFLPYHWGIPCEDWLRVVMNRLDPDFFGLLQRLGERVAAAGRRPRRDQACPGEGRGQDLAPQLRPREG
jgi:hypothetical protein